MKSPLHRTTAVLAGTLLGLAGAVALAAPASAQEREREPIIESTSACVAPDGSWTVSWKLSNSDADFEAQVSEIELSPQNSTLTGIAVDDTVPKWGTGELTGVQTLPATSNRAVLKVTLFWDRPDRNGAVYGWGELDKPTLACSAPNTSPSPSPSVSSKPTAPLLDGPAVVYSMGCDEFSFGVVAPANGKPETVTFTPSVGEPKTITAAPGELQRVYFPTLEELTVKAVPHSAPEAADTTTYRSSDYCRLGGTYGASGRFEWESGSESVSASPSPSSVTDEAAGGTAGGGALPVTGVAIGGVVGGAALLLVAGVVLFVMARRRKVRFTA